MGSTSNLHVGRYFIKIKSISRWEFGTTGWKNGGKLPPMHPVVKPSPVGVRVIELLFTIVMWTKLFGPLSVEVVAVAVAAVAIGARQKAAIIAASFSPVDFMF